MQRVLSQNTSKSCTDLAFYSAKKTLQIKTKDSIHVDYCVEIFKCH